MKTLFTLVVITSAIMPSSCSSFPSVVPDEDDSTLDQPDYAQPTKKVECHHFNESAGECSTSGQGCNVTVTCESRESEPNPACFILWESKKIMETDPSTGKTIEKFGGPLIKLKGCWNGHSAIVCSETSECIEHRKNAKKDLFFCCCRGDYCNNDFTHKPMDEPYSGLLLIHLSKCLYP